MIDPAELERARGMVSSPVYVIALLLFGALADSLLRRASRPHKGDKEPDGRH